MNNIVYQSWISSLYILFLVNTLTPIMSTLTSMLMVFSIFTSNKMTSYLNYIHVHCFMDGSTSILNFKAISQQFTLWVCYYSYTFDPRGWDQNELVFQAETWESSVTPPSASSPISNSFPYDLLNISWNFPPSYSVYSIALVWDFHQNPLNFIYPF